MNKENNFKPGDKLKFLNFFGPMTCVECIINGAVEIVVVKDSDGAIFNGPKFFFTPWIEPAPDED